MWQEIEQPNGGLYLSKRSSRATRESQERAVGHDKGEKHDREQRGEQQRRGGGTRIRSNIRGGSGESARGEQKEPSRTGSSWAARSFASGR